MRKLMNEEPNARTAGALSFGLGNSPASAKALPAGSCMAFVLLGVKALPFNRLGTLTIRRRSLANASAALVQSWENDQGGLVARALSLSTFFRECRTASALSANLLTD
jgi:hypothetical protein